MQRLNSQVRTYSARQLLRRAMAATLPRRMFMVQGPARSQTVCLTFDDGPHPQHTPQLLDVLQQNAVRATFFVVGQQVEKYPELVRRMADEGHEVGHHTYHHRAPGKTSPTQLMTELQQTNRLLRELLGNEPALFRPPLGKLTVAKLSRLWRAGQTVVLWNVDPKDFACSSAGPIEAFFRQSPLQAGDLVLMHDHHPFAAEIVRELVQATSQNGLRFVTVGEWL